MPRVGCGLAPWQRHSAGCTPGVEPARLSRPAAPGPALQSNDAALREAYLEGEMEALGQAAKEVPAGTAMGAYLQEIRASGEGSRGLAACSPTQAAGTAVGTAACGGQSGGVALLVSHWVTVDLCRACMGPPTELSPPTLPCRPAR